MSISGISWNSPSSPNMDSPFSSPGSLNSAPAQSGSAPIPPVPEDEQASSQDSQQSNIPGGVQQDFQNLTKALISGDLVGAQQAFAALQQDLQKADGHRHYHHHENSGDNGSAQAANAGGDGGSNNSGTGAQSDPTVTAVNATANANSDNGGTGSQVNLTA